MKGTITTNIVQYMEKIACLRILPPTITEKVRRFFPPEAQRRHRERQNCPEYGEFFGFGA